MNASEVHIVNEAYLDKSMKSDTRKKRGQPGPRVHLEGYDQNMLQGSNWHDFLHQNDNKTDLIRLITRFSMKMDAILVLYHLFSQYIMKHCKYLIEAYKKLRNVITKKPTRG